MEEEFDRQIINLLQKGYQKLAGLSEKDFLKLLESLRGVVKKLAVKKPDFEEGYLPFVIVIKSELIPAEKMMQVVSYNGKEGITKLYPHKPTDFKTIDKMEIPKSQAYLLTGLDRGKDTVNITPEHALKIIQSKKRFPLTIDEGIAIITQFPHFLIKNNCFSLLASRTGKDQRVPAIWINAQKHANLGWCWEKNPHTWLGSASCKKRNG